MKPYFVLAQRDNNWCFGDSITINFSSGVPVVTQTSVSASIEANASISDNLGNLLFYIGTMSASSGFGKIWNANNNVILNGDSINLYSSSTNGALICPSSFDSLKFYLFTNTSAMSSQPLSLFVSTLTVGNPPLIVGKNSLISPSLITEKIAGVKHGNGKDWWIITHSLNADTFFVYLVDSVGMQLISSQNIGFSYQNGSFPWAGMTGEISFSVQGDKLCCVGYGILDLFDFNRCTGQLSNYQDLITGPRFTALNDLYGVSFSPNGNYLYCSNWTNSINCIAAPPCKSQLSQYDLSSSNIPASKLLLADIDSTQFSLGQHQLGPDGKIYVARCKRAFPNYIKDSVNTTLSVIQNPDHLGTACNFQLNGFSLGNSKVNVGLPNSPNYNLGAWVGSPCDTLSVGIVKHTATDFHLSPNPAHDKITISTFGDIHKVKLQLRNLQGQLLHQQTESTGRTFEFILPPHFPVVYTCWKSLVRKEW
ncbi:MAG: hypothetical protein IPJ86_03120 [Bacteroidetes bacterium]|nr:hypothetical protein [Bacteroidota bacterium]